MATLVGAIFDEHGKLGAEDCNPVAAIGESVSFVNSFGPGSGPYTGTAGNDLYFVNSTSTTITEAASGGTDLVVSTVSYTLGNNVEHLLLTGNADINGTGNGLDNVITGNTGDNVLAGGAGNDFIVAGGGNDFVDGGTGNDTICTGSGDDTVLGGTGNNFINAGTGDDSVNGGANEDTVYGGTGDDSISGNAGYDEIYGDDGNDKIDGGKDCDYLDGGANDDTIDGGSGNDTFIGGYGDDYLTGGSGDDVFIYSDNSGFDTITDFDIGADVIEINAHVNGSDIATAADVLGHITEDANGNAVVNLGAASTITLIGIDEHDVTSGFFHIV